MVTTIIFLAVGKSCGQTYMCRIRKLLAAANSLHIHVKCGELHFSKQSKGLSHLSSLAVLIL